MDLFWLLDSSNINEGAFCRFFFPLRLPLPSTVVPNITRNRLQKQRPFKHFPNDCSTDQSVFIIINIIVFFSTINSPPRITNRRSFFHDLTINGFTVKPISSEFCSDRKSAFLLHRPFRRDGDGEYRDADGVLLKLKDNGRRRYFYFF